MESINWNSLVPAIFSIISVLAAFYKIREIQDKKVNAIEDELRAYVDREILHLREMSFGEIKQLEKKIDDLREDLRKNQEQLIEILTKGK